MRINLVTLATALGLAISLSSAATANSETALYSAWSCTLQGTTGITYVIEGARYSELRGACAAFKSALHQKELRWGLHQPSVSSGEDSRATWLSKNLQLKLTLLARKLPALPSLIRATAALLSGAQWKRVSTSNYP